MLTHLQFQTFCRDYTNDTFLSVKPADKLMQQIVSNDKYNKLLIQLMNIYQI